MTVDEALRVADNPRNYTSLEQADARTTLATEVRSRRAERVRLHDTAFKIRLQAEALERRLQGPAFEGG